MAESDLVLTWESSSIIRSRFRRGLKWLQWPTLSCESLGSAGGEGSADEDEKVEKHSVSTKALELNADALLAMLDAYNGNFIDVYALQKEVKSLYKLMKYDSMDVKKDSYLDSWDLRRLYSYSFRRQLDASKRVQVPRDEKVKLLFDRIAKLRQQWKELGEWDPENPHGNDDDQFEAAPEPTPPSGDASGPVTPAVTPAQGFAQEALQRQLDQLDVPHASLSEDQRHHLFGLLAEIESFENPAKSQAVTPSTSTGSPSPASAMPALPQQPLDPSQVDTQPLLDEHGLPGGTVLDLSTPSPVGTKPAEETPEKVDAPPRVTPALQNEMRTGKRKVLKRGRKSKKGAKAKGKAKNAKNSKVAKGKRAKGMGSNLDDYNPDVGTDVAKPKRKRAATPKSEGASVAKPKAKAKSRSKSKEGEARVKQERVGSGKYWRYRVVEGQQFGCRNCRFIINGCKSCKKEGFRGRTAQQVWEEEDRVGQDQVDEAEDMEEAEDVEEAVAADHGSRRAKKVRKAKKSKA